jgi:hypothetical protein
MNLSMVTGRFDGVDGLDGLDGLDDDNNILVLVLFRTIVVLVLFRTIVVLTLIFGTAGTGLVLLALLSLLRATISLGESRHGCERDKGHGKVGTQVDA